MANVIFKRGTRDIFDALEVKNADTLYWLTDTQELYQGDKLFGVGREATAEAAGLLSAEDKAKLDALVAGTVSGLTPVDASIIIGDGENGEKTIKVGLSAVDGNILTVQDDGLYASAESVEQIATDAANEAINEFANQVSDDGTVNTIKELIDYVSTHAPEAADMAADIGILQTSVGSLPDTILSEIVNVQRTETTNTAEIRIFTKQEDGTYSPAVQHGVLTLIPAGQGVDGVNGAGLMTAADKAKLDSIDVDIIESMAESLTWGSL